MSKPTMSLTDVEAVEGQPLLAGSKYPVESAAATAAEMQAGVARQWDGRLLNCFGNCDAPGWASLALVWTCPAVPFGINMKRAFPSRSAWLEGLKYIVFFGALYYLYVLAAGGVMQACPPPPGPKHHPGPGGHMDKHWDPKWGQPQMPGANEAFTGLVAGSAGTLDILAGTGNPHHPGGGWERHPETAGTGGGNGSGFDAALDQAASVDDAAAAQQLAALEEEAVSDDPVEAATNALAGTGHPHHKGGGWERKGVGQGGSNRHGHHDDEEDDKKDRKHKEQHDSDDDDDDEDDHDRRRSSRKLKEGGKHHGLDHHGHHGHHGLHHMMRKLKEGDWQHSPHHHEDVSPECQRAYNTLGAFYALAVFIGAMGIVYAARRRYEIRQRFNIAGSAFGDLCAWCWCSSCALCQETRTLMANNVTQGVWFGPTQMVSYSVQTSAPVAPQMGHPVTDKMGDPVVAM